MAEQGRYPVRNAKLEDMGLLAEIMVRSFRSAFASFMSKETLDACTEERNCRAMLECVYREGKMHFLIAGSSGMLVWQDAEEDTAEIVAVHSLPESWGTGCGEVMLREALAQMRAAGKRSVFLWAFQENQRARRFYEKYGLRWDGSVRNSEFDGAAEVRYEMEGL